VFAVKKWFVKMLAMAVSMFDIEVAKLDNSIRVQVTFLNNVIIDKTIPIVVW
jgi:hypothetical protein